MEEHITYNIDEEELPNENPIDLETNLKYFLMEFENSNHEDEVFSEIKTYDLSYNIKQLLLICDYYGISKGMLKTSKMKKQDIIEQIVLFENNDKNLEIVRKRKEVWYYVEELKRDKFMKKFVLW